MFEIRWLISCFQQTFYDLVELRRFSPCDSWRSSCGWTSGRELVDAFFSTQFCKSVGNISESGLLFYSHGRNLLQFLVHRRKVQTWRCWACLNFSLLQFLSICPFTPTSFMKAWLLLSSSRLFHLHLSPPLCFTPLCRPQSADTSSGRPGSTICCFMLLSPLFSFSFCGYRITLWDTWDICRPLKGSWVRVELLLLTPPLSEQLKKAQTSHWCRAMQIKPRGAVDECVRGFLLSAHFHFFFCCLPPVLLERRRSSAVKVNIEQRNHLRMRCGLRAALCLQTTAHFKGTVHPKIPHWFYLTPESDDLMKQIRSVITKKM